MRILSLVIAALMAGSLVAEARQRSSGPPVLEAPKGTGAISGVVTDATTGRPVEGAMVSLGVTTGGSIILTLPRVMTDPKGRFLFRDLAPSTKYYIRAAHVGYAPARFGSSGPGKPTSRSDMEIWTTDLDYLVTIAVAADQWVSDLQISLWRMGSITGRVLDERGEPAVGVAVRGFSTAWVAGHTQFVGTDVVTTDDRGEYRLANLMPGKYAVSVLSVQSTVLDSTPEAEQKRAIGELARGGSNSGLPAVDVDGIHRLAVSNFATPPPPRSISPRAYPAQFYSGTSAMSSAQLVEIPYGGSRRGVDFQLQPVPAVRVSGRVILAEGGAGDASSMLLRLMPVGNERLGFGSEAATTVVRRDGSFTFLNVPSGEYTLLAQAVFGELTSGNGELSLPDAPGFPSGVGQAPMGSSLPGLAYSSHSGKIKMWGRASVAVGASDVAGLVVPMRPAITVRGRVVFSGGSGMRLSAAIGAQPANGDPSLGLISAFVPVDGETPFSLEGLGGGTYLIGLPSWFAQYTSVVSVTSAGREIRDTGLDTSAGRDIDDVVITLTESVTSIQGAVHGEGAAGAAVIVFPVDRARWVDYGFDPLLIKSKSTDNDGVFLMNGLPEGEYFAVAVDRSQHDAWTNPKFLEAASAVATRIPLKWGDKKSLDLQVSKVVVK